MRTSIARPQFKHFAAAGAASLVLLGLISPSRAVGSELAACDAATHVQVLQPAAMAQSLPARGVWLDGRRLQWTGVDAAAGPVKLVYSARGQLLAREGEALAGADAQLVLPVAGSPWPEALLRPFQYLGAGARFELSADDAARVRGWSVGQLLLVQEDATGRVRRATRLQHAAALDDWFAAAESAPALGATPGRAGTRFAVWAPTAQKVAVCLHPDARGPAQRVLTLQRDPHTGVWQHTDPAVARGAYYTYLVEVFVPGVGMVRNRVTDPYALSLSANSLRTQVVDLADPALKPAGWDRSRAPGKVRRPTDLVIYELHVRDFSIGDASVPPAHRGKYLAFTHAESRGMQHLKALARAGMTDVHLLPVFDFATVPEQGCVTPSVSGPPDGEGQQAAIAAVKDKDCFNWGYDPLHYTAPEGSFATDADDGHKRIVEFRQMVMALHRAGLRVGMDVVYNHTSASGQHPHSVLDRIVPGYYQRLNGDGEVERSTCCDNTATEHRMMGRLMLDSVLTWAKHYHIDSFRFDLMAHQPRELMERLQQRLKAEVGREIPLLGEGWNFGEVADGARFVQASQLSLNGTDIGTFSDRARDAVRGGSAGDSGALLVQRQGWVNGLVYDRNDQAPEPDRVALLRAADLVRVGLAGTLRDYPLRTHTGEVQPLHRIDYAGQPAGYASQPSEVVNYVENHDNQTLWDNNLLKLPRSTSLEDRARVQLLAAATTAFSQGLAYFHAGIEILRSKSLDRNSYDSGDWFNRLDWTYTDNGFGAGLPIKSDNESSWPVFKPLLADPALKPAPALIAWTRDAFLDLLRIRDSSSLFRLPSAREVQRRLRFHNTGPEQEPTVIVGQLDGRGWPGAGYRELVYLLNVDKQAHEVAVPELQGRRYRLHPVHLRADAADRRARDARFDPARGRFTVPARTAVVFVLR